MTAMGLKPEAADLNQELLLSADSRPSRAAQGAGFGPQSARSVVLESAAGFTHYQSYGTALMRCQLNAAPDG